MSTSDQYQDNARAVTRALNSYHSRTVGWALNSYHSRAMVATGRV